jgi:hypothetical protein
MNVGSLPVNILARLAFPVELPRAHFARLPGSEAGDAPEERKARGTPLVVSRMRFRIDCIVGWCWGEVDGKFS